MFGPLIQMTSLVGLTHGFRLLARWLGPRRSGLLMGLPSTTAFVLVTCGMERGLDEAAGAAEACLPGLVAAATVPVAFGRMMAGGWGLFPSAFMAVFAYVSVALGLCWVPGMGLEGCVMFAGLGLLTACHLAGRIRPRLSEPIPARAARRPLPPGWQLAYRTAVPMLYFAGMWVLRTTVGTDWARSFITFPGMSLAVLMATHIESGPTIARRLAAAMPSGSLGMLAFLTFFRMGCPRMGLGWGTLFSYSAAVIVLLLIETITIPRGVTGLAVKSRPGRAAWLSPLPSWLRDVLVLKSDRPRPRCFSPRFEMVGG